MTKTIAVIGALDTKGREVEFVANEIRARGVGTLIVDVGVLEKPSIAADVARADVAAAGGARIEDLVRTRDRGEAVARMSAGLARLLPELYAQGRFDGVISMGGTGGTSVACAGMRALALGVPKVMISTVAGSDVSGYVGVTDIVMIPSIVDVAGINKISRAVFAKAAGAIVGMVTAEIAQSEDRPLIAASMFGNTTPAVERAKLAFEAQGYEVLVFHCTGNGGRTLESLVAAGMITAVFDLTTTELADELVGGVFSAGPTRLTAAAAKGVPAIVTPACLDMVNFWAPETVPAQFTGRRFYPHNPNVTLMRTTPEENRTLGKMIAERLNRSVAPVTVLIPGKGISMIDAPGGPFWWPEADAALFTALTENLRSDIETIRIDANVNDPEFVDRCIEKLLENIAKHAHAR